MTQKSLIPAAFSSFYDRFLAPFNVKNRPFNGNQTKLVLYGVSLGKRELWNASGFRIVVSVRATLRLEMQLSGKKPLKKSSAKNLTELKPGEEGILEALDLPESDAQRLMEMGFIPGHAITRGLSAPGGDPRVFRVDGTEVALRRDTARRLLLK